MSRYSGTLDLPVALALLAAAGKLRADRIAAVVAVGGLDPCAADEKAGVRCIGGRGTTAFAHAAQTRGLRLIVAEDQRAAASAECHETTGSAALDGRRQIESEDLAEADRILTAAGGSPPTR